MWLISLDSSFHTIFFQGKMIFIIETKKFILFYRIYITLYCYFLKIFYIALLITIDLAITRHRSKQLIYFFKIHFIEIFPKYVIKIKDLDKNSTKKTSEVYEDQRYLSVNDIKKNERKFQIEEEEISQLNPLTTLAERKGKSF